MNNRFLLAAIAATTVVVLILAGIIWYVQETRQEVVEVSSAQNSVINAVESVDTEVEEVAKAAEDNSQAIAAVQAEQQRLAEQQRQNAESQATADAEQVQKLREQQAELDRQAAELADQERELEEQQAQLDAQQAELDALGAIVTGLGLRQLEAERALQAQGLSGVQLKEELLKLGEDFRSFRLDTINGFNESWTRLQDFKEEVEQQRRLLQEQIDQQETKNADQESVLKAHEEKLAAAANFEGYLTAYANAIGWQIPQDLPMDAVPQIPRQEETVTLIRLEDRNDGIALSVESPHLGILVVCLETAGNWNFNTLLDCQYIHSGGEVEFPHSLGVGSKMVAVTTFERQPGDLNAETHRRDFGVLWQGGAIPAPVGAQTSIAGVWVIP